jgi:hypothetical protein
MYFKRLGYKIQILKLWANRCLLRTGALKFDRGGCIGEDVAKLKLVCGVGGVIEAGIVCDECVEGGVCGGGGW